MSSAVKYSPQYTIVDYQQWEGDWELFNGVAVWMGPSPFGPHSSLLSRLNYEFERALRKQKFRDCTVLLEIDWIVDRVTVIRPDMSIIQGKPPRGHLKQVPILIVEVLSLSTAKKDRSVKFELYQQLGVKYYVIADPDCKQIEVWQLVDEKYQRPKEAKRYSFELTDRCSIRVDFRELLGR